MAQHRITTFLGGVFAMAPLKDPMAGPHFAENKSGLAGSQALGWHRLHDARPMTVGGVSSSTSPEIRRLPALRGLHEPWRLLLIHLGRPSFV